MLTKLIIQNFKKLEYVEFSLSQSVVLIGPNNAGKSTIFQALCLWEVGVRNYLEAYISDTLVEEQYDEENIDSYILINRRDFLSSPINDTSSLWRNKARTKLSDADTFPFIEIENPINLELTGEINGISWSCNVHLTWDTNESTTCRISSTSFDNLLNFYQTRQLPHFGFLQPMSGLAAQEDLLTPGAIARRLGRD